MIKKTTGYNGNIKKVSREKFASRGLYIKCCHPTRATTIPLVTPRFAPVASILMGV